MLGEFLSSRGLNLQTNSCHYVAAPRALEVRAGGGPTFVGTMEFSGYVAQAIVIHAALAVPAVIARFVNDTIMGARLFQAVKPKKRTDLY